VNDVLVLVGGSNSLAEERTAIKTLPESVAAHVERDGIAGLRVSVENRVSR
jgi:hypothetical protein